MKVVLLILLLSTLVVAASSEDAREAYLNATVHVEQMKRAGFPHGLMDGLLQDMEIALKGKNASKLLQTALILNQTEEGILRAQEYFAELESARLQGLQPGQNFSMVIHYAQLIAYKREQAFEARDELKRVEEIIAGAENINLSRVNELLQEAQDSFASEKYELIPGLVNQTEVALEDAKVAAARNRALARLARRNLLSFVEDNWLSVLVVLLIFSVLGLWGFVEGRVFYAAKKVRVLESELAAAHEGLLQAQKEYYSGESGRSTYGARTEKVHEKQRAISSQLHAWRELHAKYLKTAVIARFRPK
ncbi:hypothetical protein J4211_01215 [Candidatus Woesearchaeota archaeon]|nr:hypothetical protein [Candidatus Woesearchaeota archaeon]